MFGGRFVERFVAFDGSDGRTIRVTARARTSSALEAQAAALHELARLTDVRKGHTSSNSEKSPYYADAYRDRIRNATRALRRDGVRVWVTT